MRRYLIASSLESIDRKSFAQFKEKLPEKKKAKWLELGEELFWWVCSPYGDPIRI